MLAESLPPWRPIEVHFCLLPARRAEKEESTFPVLFSFFFLLVKQSVLICRAASPHFAYLLAHTRSLVCVYVLRIPLLMFCVTERKQEVSLWVAPLKIPHETQMVTQTLTRYLGSLIFLWSHSQKTFEMEHSPTYLSHHLEWTCSAERLKSQRNWQNCTFPPGISQYKRKKGRKRRWSLFIWFNGVLQQRHTHKETGKVAQQGNILLKIRLS